MVALRAFVGRCPAVASVQNNMVHTSMAAKAVQSLHHNSTCTNSRHFKAKLGKGENECQGPACFKASRGSLDFQRNCETCKAGFELEEPQLMQLSIRPCNGKSPTSSSSKFALLLKCAAYSRLYSKKHLFWTAPTARGPNQPSNHP